ncbi:hypothetical protein K505DRAFT_380322, partial [Melanomma pulvis-pyrius CBS 109.77]
MPPKPPLRIPRKPPPLPTPKFNAPPPNIHPPHAPKVARHQPHVSAPPQPPPPHSSKRTFQLPASFSNPFSYPRLVLSWSGTFLFGFSYFIFVRDNVVSVDTVKGSSMAPTLNKDVHETGRCEWVVISSGVKYSIEEGAVKRGDVVTFWKPGRGEELAVKRVVG